MVVASGVEGLDIMTGGGACEKRGWRGRGGMAFIAGTGAWFRLGIFRLVAAGAGRLVVFEMNPNTVTTILASQLDQWCVGGNSLWCPLSYRMDEYRQTSALLGACGHDN